MDPVTKRSGIEIPSSAAEAACDGSTAVSPASRNTGAMHRYAVDVLLFVGPSGCGKSTVIHRLQHDWPTLFEFSVSHTTRPPRHGEVDGQHYHFVSKETFQQLIDADAMIEYSCLCSHATSSTTPGSFSKAPPLPKGQGNFYGTSKAALHSVLRRNRVVLMDTDLLGAINIRRYCTREMANAKPSLALPPLAKSAMSNTSVASCTAAVSTSPLEHVFGASSLPSTPTRLPETATWRAACTDASLPRDKRPLRCLIIFIAPPSMESLKVRLRERRSETEASLQMRMILNERWMAWANANRSFFDYSIVNDDLDACYAQVKRIVQTEVLLLSSAL